jgi:hypothetical protein
MTIWVLMLQMAYAGPYVAYPTQEMCETAMNRAEESSKVKDKTECIAFSADVIQTRPPRRKYYDEAE